MSKIIFKPEGENIRITVIHRGSKVGKHNFGKMLATKEYAEQVRKFLGKRRFKALGKLMNYPNSVSFDPRNRELSFREEIHNAYFFIMYLVWALEEKLEVVEGGGAR